MKTEKTVVEIENYTPPQMTVVPVRVSGMLCMSMHANTEDASLMDFESEGNAENPGNLNGQFGTWSDEGGSSFF